MRERADYIAKESFLHCDGELIIFRRKTAYVVQESYLDLEESSLNCDEQCALWQESNWVCSEEQPRVEESCFIENDLLLKLQSLALWRTARVLEERSLWCG